MDNAWSEIQQHLRKTLDPGNYKVWIEPLSGRLEKGVLTVSALNGFVADFVRARFGDVLAHTARELCGEETALRVQTAVLPADTHGAVHRDAGSRDAAPAALPAPSALPTASVAPRGSLPEPGCAQHALPFRMPEVAHTMRAWRHSFADFVVGPNNALAFAAAQNICRNTAPDNQISSQMADMLFLISTPGLGKTHLTQAVGRELSATCNRSLPRVEYLTAEEFCSRLFMAIKAGETDRFKTRYRDVDLLLLEDVHFLQGKEKMQEELLATMKTLQERGSKIVFSSSFSPRELRDMSDQLLSRFSSGFMAVIDKPNRDTRRRILTEKAKLYQVLLPEEVTDFLAESLDSDVRQIESCLRNLILQARLLGSAITMNMAWEMVEQYATATKTLDLDGIVRYVCQGYGINSDQMASKSRKRELVNARNTVFYLARKHTGLSLEEIGSRFNRSHSTVIKGITSLEREISRESSLGRQMAGAIALIERNCDNRSIIISGSSSGGRG